VLDFTIQVATDITGAFIVISEVTPGSTSTGFTITYPTACQMKFQGIFYGCSISATDNSFYVDVTTVRLLPGEVKLTFYGLKLETTSKEGSSWNSRICTVSGCGTNGDKVVDDYSDTPVYI
jgi:hypothetical protein